jgi:D-arabinose 1-dehydrogenase-like Zn-dependent alcohol dehydrogenase
VAAVGRGSQIESLAKKLGADVYIDSKVKNSAEELQKLVPPVQLIRGSKTIEGWAGGTPADSDDTLRFAELRGVRAMIETYPLEKAAEAYARMMSGNAEFRVVLMM